MLSISLRQLEYACAVAESGGLTAAAASLNVSQPALSVALAAVEAHLGQPLFLRRPGSGLIPTPFGRDWLAAARSHLDGLQRLMQGQVPRTPLRLALFEDIAPLIQAPLLAAAPNLTLRILGFDPLAQALTQGQVELAVTWDLGLPADITRNALIHLPPQVVLTPDHPLARHPHLLLKDLENHPLVLTDQGQSLDHMRNLFARASITPRITHRCATLELMRSFAANGLGLGLSYAQPAPRQAADGKPFVVIPLIDAGTEPLILARAPHAPPLDSLGPLLPLLTRLLQPV